MTKEQYNEWRNHPATLFFRKFIKDRRESLIADATQSWLNVSAAFEKDNQTDRGRIAELFLVEDISYEVIATFYEEKNAIQIAFDQESGIHPSAVAGKE